MSAIDDLVKLLKKERRTGSDYTGTVTRVADGIAYVQLSGSDIMDTPAAMTITCRAGDKVRVRVSGGRAWITGNDTLPPSNEKKEVSEKMSKSMKDRMKDILIDFGTFTFRGNTLVVESKNFKLDKNGNGEFSGTLKGATYEDSSSNFTMDIGTREEVSGSVTPAFRIGGYVNGDPSNDYMEITISLFKGEEDVLPTLYIGAAVKDSPDATEASEVSLGVGNTEIDFYGSYFNSGHLTRLHSSIPWGYNPW